MSEYLDGVECASCAEYELVSGEFPPRTSGRCHDAVEQVILSLGALGMAVVEAPPPGRNKTDNG